jgi:hypothetical protein
MTFQCETCGKSREEPEPCDRPLYIDYSRGISLERAWNIAHGK